MIPTQEQVERFWEWCGFKQIPWKDAPISGVRTKIQDRCWLEPGYNKQVAGHWSFDSPILDLNNLFKWAVPKVVDLEGGHPFTVSLISRCGESGEYGAEIANYTLWKRGRNGPRYSLAFDKDPAIALFLAIEASTK